MMLRAFLCAAAMLGAAVAIGQEPYPPAPGYGPILSGPVSPPGPASVYGPAPPMDPRLAGPMLAPQPVPAWQPPPAAGSFGGPVVVPCVAPGGWLIGAGMLYLQPRWGNNPAYDVFSSTSDGWTETTANAQQDFEMSGHFAPLIWLGYVGPHGVGLRGRWWQLRADDSLSIGNEAQSAEGTTIYSAYPLGIGFAARGSADFNDTLRFDSKLAMDVADAEVLWDLRPGRLQLLIGGGVRYARLNQSYDANWLSAPVDPADDTISTVLNSNHSFNGIGPLVSIEARYPIGASRFALVGAVRGALLFGAGHQRVDMTSVETDPAGAVYYETDSSKSRSAGGTMPVIEFELGGEWEQRFGRYRFLVQTALVGQSWFYAGNAANQQSIFGGLPPYDANDFHDTLGLIGLRLNAGFSY